MSGLEYMLHMLRTITLILLLIMSCLMSIQGVLVLSPSGVVSVCVEIQLESNTTSDLPQWNITYYTLDQEYIYSCLDDEGQNFTCSYFNDSWISFCCKGGRWDPDPMEICKDSTVTELPPQSTVTSDTCIETPSVNTITSTVVSSVVVFILSSTLFFIIGWCGHKHKTKGSDKNITSQAAPVYEDLQPSVFMPQDQDNAFELKENVAYGPI